MKTLNDHQLDKYQQDIQAKEAEIQKANSEAKEAWMELAKIMLNGQKRFSGTENALAHFQELLEGKEKEVEWYAEDNIGLKAEAQKARTEIEELRAEKERLVAAKSHLLVEKDEIEKAVKQAMDEKEEELLKVIASRDADTAAKHATVQTLQEVMLSSLEPLPQPQAEEPETQTGLHESHQQMRDELKELATRNEVLNKENNRLIEKINLVNGENRKVDGANRKVREHCSKVTEERDTWVQTAKERKDKLDAIQEILSG